MSDTTSSSLTTPGDAPKFKPSSEPPLTEEQATEAISELNIQTFTNKFPKVDRNFADPPISLQTYGLVSFIPAKGATPNKKGIYGFAKLRGNYATEIEANQRAEMLIKEVDSVHTIYHTYVGRPFPLTVRRDYAAETSEVDIRRDTTESVSMAIKEQKDEDKKKAEEIKSRERELMEDVSGDRPQEEIDLDEYITLNVKKAQLAWTYLEHIKKIKEIKNVLVNTRKAVVEADAEHPEFRTLFYKKYTDAREKSGLTTSLEEDAKRDGFLRYLIEDVKLPGIDEMDELVDTLVNAADPDRKEVAVVPVTLKEEESKPKKVYEDDM